MNHKKIYLAGPDVFRADAKEHFNSLKQLAAKENIEAISPFDSENIPASAKEIFEVNIRILKTVGAVFANLTPFRGPGVDDGTAFEIGYAYAIGLSIYGYSNYAQFSYPEIAEKYPTADKAFPIIENFGHTCNLMIAEAILERRGFIFETFQECLAHYISNQFPK